MKSPREVFITLHNENGTVLVRVDQIASIESSIPEVRGSFLTLLSGTAVGVIEAPDEIGELIIACPA